MCPRACSETLRNGAEEQYEKVATQNASGRQNALLHGAPAAVRPTSWIFAARRKRATS